MAGPEGYIPSEPLQAVATLAPKENYSALHEESLFTPEGYDVKDPDQAERYLVEVHGRDIPKIRGEFDASTGFHLARAIQKEKRAAIYNEAGDAQSVADHSLNVAVTTIWTALKDRPDVDAGKASIMAVYHDLVVEAYGGDTPINDEEKLASKELREAAGMTLFLRDAGDSPLGQIMKEYELGRTKEARLVNGMDKVEAYQLSLDTKAVLHRKRNEESVGEDFIKTAEEALPKAAIDPTAFDKMQGVLKELGRKWMEWGCRPFEGDPNEIVDRIARRIIDESAEVTKLRETELKPHIEEEAVKDNLFEFPVPEEIRELKADQPVVFGRLATVAVLADRRRAKDGPIPPTPPASPTAIMAT